MHIITYNGKMYIFKNTMNEEESMFIERCWFIVKNMHRYSDDYAYLKNLSHIWVNHKHLQVLYDKTVMDELMACDV